MSAVTIVNLSIAGLFILAHAIQWARMTKRERREWEDKAYYTFHP